MEIPRKPLAINRLKSGALARVEAGEARARLTSGGRVRAPLPHHSWALGTGPVPMARQPADRRTGTQTERSVPAEHALISLAEAAMAGRTSQQVLEMVTGAAATLTGEATVHIWLVETDGGTLRLAAASGARPGRRDFPRDTVLKADEGLVGKIAGSREPLMLTSLRKEPGLVNLAWARNQGFVSFAGVPLVRGERLLGVLGLFTWHRHRFTRHEVNLLRAFAAHAAVAMDNARLYAEVQAHKLEVIGLAEASRRFSATLRRETILAALVEATVRLIGGLWSVLSLTPKTNEVRLAFVTDPDSAVAVPPTEADPALIEVTQTVVTSGKPLHVRSLDEVPEGHPARPHLAQLGARSAFLVPVGTPGVTHAVLVGLTRDVACPFTHGDARLAQALADRAGVALENARLFEELTQAYHDLQTAQEQLVSTEKLRALGEMASGVAHDFNNLLAVIIGHVQLIQRTVEDPTVGRWLDIIQQAADDGAQMVRRIRGFTRIRSDQPVQRVTLNQVVRDAVEMTRTRWQRATPSQGPEIQVVLKLGDLPPVDGQPGELREVLTNLILNAVDALAGGGTITITTQRVADGVEVSIGDTGVGMAEAVRRRIFEPFFTTKGPRGTGLGLAMVYGIVTRHGGHITVDSAEGGGSTFTIRLPIRRWN